MYAGKVLEVDLTKGKHEISPLGEDLRDQYIGGSALNLRLFADRCDPQVDALSPENVVVIGAGALAGSASPGSGKIAGTTKFALPASPDGKCYVASAISGSNRFGTNLRAAGYDHLVVRGKSSGPVYLLVEDGRVEICDASQLWGSKDTYETTEALRSAHPGRGVLCIGAAGANQVKFALAITDRHSTMGRNGFGAVMGSKNLKAIVVRGSQRPSPFDPDSLKGVVREIREEAKENRYAQDFHELGIHAIWDMWTELISPGIWSRAEWEQCYGPEVARKAGAGASACTGCFLACKTKLEAKEGKRKGQRMETGHFLDIAVLAQFLGLRDWPDMAYLMDLCNRAGLCGVSGIGSTFVLSMAQGIGLLKEGETPGVDFTGDVEKYASLLQLVSGRRGAGNAVADGWFSLFEYLDGTDLSALFGLVKGAFCFYDMRDTNLDVRSFHMVVNPRGAHHPQCHWTMSAPRVPFETLRKAFLETGATPEDAERIFRNGDVKVGRLTRHVQDAGMVMDSIGSCVFYNIIGLPLHLENLSRIYTAATGKKTSAAHLKRCGERGHNLLKLLNVRAGFGREDDRFPALWMEPKVTPDGEVRLMDYYGRRELREQDLVRELDEYYDERGWNLTDSHPTPEKLEELGLSGLVS